MDECAAGRRYVEREGVMALCSVAQFVCVCVCVGGQELRHGVSRFSTRYIALTEYIFNPQMVMSRSLFPFLPVRPSLSLSGVSLWEAGMLPAKRSSAIVKPMS